MGAVLLVPDPTRAASSLSLSPTSLSLVVAGAAAIVLGMCFVAAVGDRRSKDKLQRQKLLREQSGRDQCAPARNISAHCHIDYRTVRVTS